MASPIFNKISLDVVPMITIGRGSSSSKNTNNNKNTAPSPIKYQMPIKSSVASTNEFPWLVPYNDGHSFNKMPSATAPMITTGAMDCNHPW